MHSASLPLTNSGVTASLRFSQVWLHIAKQKLKYPNPKSPYGLTGKPSLWLATTNELAALPAKQHVDQTANRRRRVWERCIISEACSSDRIVTPRWFSVNRHRKYWTAFQALKKKKKKKEKMKCVHPSVAVVKSPPRSVADEMASTQNEIRPIPQGTGRRWPGAEVFFKLYKKLQGVCGCDLALYHWH